MISDRVSSPPGSTASAPCFIFDPNLNVLKAPPGDVWPAAVMAVLRSCVRRALVQGRPTFAPFGMGPDWYVVPLWDDGPRRIAVFTDARTAARPL